MKKVFLLPVVFLVFLSASSFAETWNLNLSTGETVKLTKSSGVPPLEYFDLIASSPAQGTAEVHTTSDNFVTIIDNIVAIPGSARYYNILVGKKDNLQGKRILS